MSNSFTLDDIKASAEKKYGATETATSDGSTVRFLNPLRLSKANRKALMALQKELSKEAEEAEEGEEVEEVDQDEILANILLTVSEDKATTKKLLKEIDGDMALLLEIFERYNESGETGEA